MLFLISWSTLWQYRLQNFSCYSESISVWQIDFILPMVFIQKFDAVFVMTLIQINTTHNAACVCAHLLWRVVVWNRAKTSRPENKKGKLWSSCHGFSKRWCMLLHSVLVPCGKPWLCKQEVLPWLPAQCVLRSTSKGCTVQHYWLMLKPRHQFVWRVILSISPLFSARLKRFGTNSCRETFDVFPWLYFDQFPGFVLS